jgi:hypothetical protein
MLRNINPYYFTVLFYFKPSSTENGKHERFFKYTKPKLLNEIDKQETMKQKDLKKGMGLRI